MSSKATAKESPLVVDFLVHVAESPDINPFGVVDPLRERQDDPWLDLLMARRVGDPWFVRIGDRETCAPHIRIASPEEEAREARGGMAAPITRVGLVYAGRLRAQMPVKQLVRHVDGLFLVLDIWKQFFPVVSRDAIPWFAGWKEREFRSDEVMVSENWAVGGLNQVLAKRVKELLALPPFVRGKAVGHPAEQTEQSDDHTWQTPASSTNTAPQSEKRVVVANESGQTRVEKPVRAHAGAPAQTNKKQTKKTVPSDNSGQRSLW